MGRLYLVLFLLLAALNTCSMFMFRCANFFFFRFHFHFTTVSASSLLPIVYFTCIYIYSFPRMQFQPLVFFVCLLIALQLCFVMTLSVRVFFFRFSSSFHEFFSSQNSNLLRFFSFFLLTHSHVLRNIFSLHPVNTLNFSTVSFFLFYFVQHDHTKQSVNFSLVLAAAWLACLSATIIRSHTFFPASFFFFLASFTLVLVFLCSCLRSHVYVCACSFHCFNISRMKINFVLFFQIYTNEVVHWLYCFNCLQCLFFREREKIPITL